MLTPPQGTAIDAVDLSSLSRTELSDLWVASLHETTHGCPHVLREISRRHWARVRETAEDGSPIMEAPHNFV